MVMNKRAAEMAVGTIVIIIIAIILLVLLVFAASGAFGDFYNKYFVLGGGQVNFPTHINACKTACATGDEGSYCLKRDVVFTKDRKDTNLYAMNSDQGQKIKYTCDMLEEYNIKQINPAIETGLDDCINIEGCSSQVSN